MGYSSCPICSGSGNRGEESCPVCGGAGRRTGFENEPCYFCSGRGRVDKKCSACGGSGQVADSSSSSSSYSGGYSPSYSGSSSYGYSNKRGTSSGGCLGKFIVMLVILGLLGGGVYLARNYIEPAVSRLTELTKAIQTRFAATSTATVTADALNFRAGPSASHNVIKTLKKGDTLTVTGNAKNGWVPVRHGSDSGWVSGEMISISK